MIAATIKATAISAPIITSGAPTITPGANGSSVSIGRARAVRLADHAVGKHAMCSLGLFLTPTRASERACSSSRFVIARTIHGPGGRGLQARSILSRRSGM